MVGVKEGFNLGALLDIGDPFTLFPRVGIFTDITGWILMAAHKNQCYHCKPHHFYYWTLPGNKQCWDINYGECI